MPLYNWTVLIVGQTDAPSQDALEKTLKNQTSFSVNIAGSVKKILVSSEPDSGLILPGDPHGAGG